MEPTELMLQAAQIEMSSLLILTYVGLALFGFLAIFLVLGGIGYACRKYDGTDGAAFCFTISACFIIICIILAINPEFRIASKNNPALWIAYQQNNTRIHIEKPDVKSWFEPEEQQHE